MCCLPEQLFLWTCTPHADTERNKSQKPEDWKKTSRAERGCYQDVEIHRDDDTAE